MPIMVVENASSGVISQPVLEVTGLTAAVSNAGRTVPIVDDLTLEIRRGQTLGLVGESGCGKTMASRAIIGVLPPAVRVVAGSVRLTGQELLGLKPDEWSEVRGKRISMIFQDAMRCLNPVFTVGEQIAEVARRHLGMSRRQAWSRAIEMLELVAIREPSKRAGQYPAELSGGMAQRVMIAMAIVAEPDVLIADEPTTALDVTVQAQVLLLLQRLQQDLGLGLLFITHDLGVVAEMCDDVAVMYAGQIVETAPVVELFEHPKHPYTAGLLDSLPKLIHRLEPFRSIPGVVPAPQAWPAGCRFGPRCPFRVAERCDASTPALEEAAANHEVRCVRASEIVLPIGRSS